VRMLTLLFQKEGDAVSRSELLERVWGYANDVETRICIPWLRSWVLSCN